MAECKNENFTFRDHASLQQADSITNTYGSAGGMDRAALLDALRQLQVELTQAKAQGTVDVRVVDETAQAVAELEQPVANGDEVSATLNRVTGITDRLVKVGTSAVGLFGIARKLGELTGHPF